VRSLPGEAEEVLRAVRELLHGPGQIVPSLEVPVTLPEVRDRLEWLEAHLAEVAPVLERVEALAEKVAELEVRVGEVELGRGAGGPTF